MLTHTHTHTYTHTHTHTNSYLRGTFTLRPSVLFLFQHNHRQEENLVSLGKEQKIST